MINFTRILVRLWIRDPDFRSLVFLELAPIGWPRFALGGSPNV
jgi:hypothetical protein